MLRIWEEILKPCLAALIAAFVAMFIIEFFYYETFKHFLFVPTEKFVATMTGLKIILFILGLTAIMCAVRDVQPLRWFMLLLVLIVIALGVVDGYWFVSYGAPLTSFFPSISRAFGPIPILVALVVIIIFSYRRDEGKDSDEVSEMRKSEQSQPQSTFVQTSTVPPTRESSSGGAEGMENIDGGMPEGGAPDGP